jgi:hypothetical protein
VRIYDCLGTVPVIMSYIPICRFHVEVPRELMNHGMAVLDQDGT